MSNVHKHHPILKSLSFAWQGVLHTIRNQRNMRIHLVVAFIVLFAGWWFHCSRMEWCILLFCIGVVLSAEMLNSAIEDLTDHVSPEWNKHIGAIKDMAAAAVLILAMISFAAGLIIFVPKIFHLTCN